MGKRQKIYKLSCMIKVKTKDKFEKSISDLLKLMLKGNPDGKVMVYNDMHSLKAYGFDRGNGIYDSLHIVILRTHVYAIEIKTISKENRDSCLKFFKEKYEVMKQKRNSGFINRINLDRKV